MKHTLAMACLLGLALQPASAQSKFSIDKGGETFVIPIGATITVCPERGFVFSYANKEYEFPLDTEVSFSDDASVNLPLAVKNTSWKNGFSSYQSNSTGILSDRSAVFSWKGDNIRYSDYNCSGTVVDTVANVPMTADRSHLYGDKVDLVYYKNSDGKYGAIILAYATDGTTGRRVNIAVGVDYWHSSLSTYTGVSGKTYELPGTLQYFDDLDTAKDVTMNMDNFSKWGEGKGSMAAPTWMFISKGTRRKGRTPSKDEELGSYAIDYFAWTGRKKPTQQNLDEKTGWRFDTPDSASAIVNYYYTATDSTAIQFPMLKSGSGDPDADAKNPTENYTWMGATCVYLVPWNGSSMSKYRKFDGYLHVCMVDGSEYRQHFSIPTKKGYIEASGTWEKTKEATIPFDSLGRDEGRFYYTNMKFMVRPYATGDKYGSNVKTFAEARAFEQSLDDGQNVQLTPKVDAYVPYTMVGKKPAKKVHYCNFGFKSDDCPYLSATLLDKGVLLQISDSLSYTHDQYTSGYNSWMFTDEEGCVVTFTTSELGGLTGEEWYE